MRDQGLEVRVGMMDPLPFRVSRPGRDRVGLEGVETIAYRVDGVLHLLPDSLALEWEETRTSDRFSLEGIGTDVEQYALEPLEIPLGMLSGAWVVGGWWWPRLELRARSLDVFEGVPGARGVTLTLRIKRRDRALARRIAASVHVGAT